MHINCWHNNSAPRGCKSGSRCSSSTHYHRATGLRHNASFGSEIPNPVFRSRPLLHKVLNVTRAFRYRSEFGLNSFSRCSVADVLPLMIPHAVTFSKHVDLILRHELFTCLISLLRSFPGVSESVLFILPSREIV
jgi:hypothetical protein